MCTDCKDVVEVDDKKQICRICGIEKPVNEFQKGCYKKGIQHYGLDCKVCISLKNRPDLIIREGWIKEEYIIVLDLLLNNKIKYVNEILPYLKYKTLEDLYLVLKDIGLKGVNLQVKYLCDNINCNKEKVSKIYDYFKSKNHYCSYECKNICNSNTYGCEEGFMKCGNCNKIKPKEEFHLQGKDEKGNNKYKTTCKVCSWIKNNDELEIYSNLNEDDYKFILDCLLNEKVTTINEFITVHKLDIDLILLIKIIKSMKISATKLKVSFDCDNCGLENNITTISEYLHSVSHFCSKECYDEFQTESIEKECDNCGKTILVPPRKIKSNKHFFCSQECDKEYKNKNIVIREYCWETLCCEQCGKDFKVTKGELNNRGRRFCSQECFKNNQKDSYITYNCDNCGKEHNIRRSDYNFDAEKHFCDNKCKFEYNKKVSYSKLIKFNCQYCNKETEQLEYAYGNSKNHFCSRDCTIKWFKEIYSKTDEFSDRCKKQTVKALSEGKFSHTNTEIQLIVNKILDDNNIKFTNEYNCTYFAIDNAIKLNNKIYFIEVMGGFWHCDRRYYPSISYFQQWKKIRSDKSKHTYIKKYYGIEILYLWEKDILENEELCKELILEYINNNGNLQNYHSFNYILNNDNKLILNRTDEAYMDLKVDVMNNYVDFKIKQQISKRQEDKHIIVECSCCGKEIDVLKSEMDKKENKFCSKECYSKSQKKQVSVKCECCNKIFNIAIGKYEKSNTKIFYCCRECYDIEKSKNKVTFNCTFCKKENTVNSSHYNKNSDLHFCNRECNRLYLIQENKNKTKTMIEFICDGCGKPSKKSPSQYNKSEHHFCTNECYLNHKDKLIIRDEKTGKFINKNNKVNSNLNNAIDLVVNL